MPSEGQATKLNDLDTRSVDLVTRGANKKRFAFKKGDQTMTAQEALIEILKQADPDQDWAGIDKMCSDAGLDAQGAETYKALVKLSAAYKDSPAMAKMVGSHLTKLFGAGGGKDPAPAQPKNESAEPDEPGEQSMQDKPTDGGEQPPAGGAKPPATPAEEPKEKPMSKKDESAGTQQAADTGKTPSAEELQKSIDERVSKAVAEAIAKSTEASNVVIKGLEAKLVEQADRALKGEWVQKAKDHLAHVPGKTTEELGSMLFDIEKSAGKAVADVQFDVLKGASAAVAKSSAFTPAGFHARGTAATSSMTKLQEAASKIAKSAEGGLSEAMAVAKALEQDPSLYAEYLNEHPTQRGRAEYTR